MADYPKHNDYVTMGASNTAVTQTKRDEQQPVRPELRGAPQPHPQDPQRPEAPEPGRDAREEGAAGGAAAAPWTRWPSSHRPRSVGSGAVGSGTPSETTVGSESVGSGGYAHSGYDGQAHFAQAAAGPSGLSETVYAPYPANTQPPPPPTQPPPPPPPHLYVTQQSWAPSYHHPHHQPTQHQPTPPPSGYHYPQPPALAPPPTYYTQQPAPPSPPPPGNRLYHSHPQYVQQPQYPQYPQYAQYAQQPQHPQYAQQPQHPQYAQHPQHPQYSQHQQQPPPPPVPFPAPQPIEEQPSLTARKSTSSGGSWGPPGDMVTGVCVQMCAAELAIKDIFTRSSDPYVKVMLGGVELARTNVVKKNLSPRWQAITLPFKKGVTVADIGQMVFTFEVWDKDWVKEDDEIGTATATLEDMKRCTNLRLISTKHRNAGKDKCSGILYITKCDPSTFRPPSFSSR